MDMGIKIPQENDVPREFLQKVIDAVGKNSRFYAIDVAKTKSGKWIVIELNEGQMAGLSENNADLFYKKLRQ